ncbi:MAG: carboxypeptidase regulatory-like domain-containing protein [Candidatus Marinimicrobia bacterium]|nr:carboxypeptidase regulatory-like domain-containing protein [Candidatus Neomarinimicrobiota bacterium]
MRKSTVIFMCVLLLFSFAPGANRDAVQSVSKLRMMKTLTAKKNDATVAKSVATPSRAIVNESRQVKQFVDTQSAISKRPAAVKLNWKEMFTVNGGQENAKVMIATPDTLLMTYGGTDSIAYTAGDLFYFVVPAPDTVFFDIFVDDGDSILTENDPSISEFTGETLILLDGQEPDMTPAGDGIVGFAMTTTMLDDISAFFGLQGFRLFLVAELRTVPLPAIGIIDILAPDENTSISGFVQYGQTSLQYVAVWAVFLGDTIMPTKEENMVGFLTATDANGAYTIEIPDAYRGLYIVGTEDVWGLYPGLYPTQMQQPIYVNTDVTGINIAYEQATDQIYGTVRNDFGTPISGLTIYAEGSFYPEAVTDVNGQYTLTVSPGYWRLYFNTDELTGRYMNINERYVEVISGVAHQEDFILYTTDGTIEGYVVDVNQARLADIEVGANIGTRPDSTGNQENYYAWTKTDATGHYILHVSKALQHPEISAYNATYNVWCWTETGVPIPNGHWGIVADTTGLNFMILSTNATLSGTIFDETGHNPLTNAGIHIWGNIPGVTEQVDQWYWTGDEDNGSYEFDLVGGTSGILYQIEVYYPNSWMPSITDSIFVMAGDKLTRDYYISQPQYKGRLEGYVYQRGTWNGIVGAHVVFTGTNYYEQYTGEGGHYAVENVDAGWYTGTATAPGYPSYTVSDISVSDYTTWVDFVLGSDSSKVHVSGTVTKQTTGSPLVGVLAVAFGYDGSESAGMLTDSLGKYEFYLRPGTYDFQIGGNGYWAINNDSVWVNCDTVFNYQLTPADFADSLIGYVTDNLGNPLKMVAIYMESANYMALTFTDSNGRYFVGLPAGDYYAVFSEENYNEEYRNFTWPGGTIDNPLIMYPEGYMPKPTLIEVMDVPMDQGKQVRLTWNCPELLKNSVKEFQIWRAVDPLNGSEMADGENATWDFIATVSAHPDWQSYNYVAPTLYDKVQNVIYWTGFMVTAIGYDNWSYWDSNVKGGWSEDNLAPEIPLNLTGKLADSKISLTWDEVISEPVKYYTVYRKADAAEFTLLGYATTTEYVDANVTSNKIYTYSVTATDYGLNESKTAASINMTMTSIGQTLELPKSFALSQNYPNPFNPRTSIDFALPKASDIRLTIFNLMGQIVKEYSVRELPIGYHRYVWDGRDASGNLVSGGVYIYTLTAGDFKQTKKMILLK